MARPQAKLWNWQLTVLVGLMFVMAAWFLLIAYRDLTSDKVPNAVQTLVTWIGVGVGNTALALAFLLRSRSRVGWLSTTVLVSFLAVVFTVSLSRLFLSVYHGVISEGDLFPGVLVELALLHISYFMCYLVSNKAVRGVLDITDSWLRFCLTVGGTLGAVVVGWLIV